MVNKPAKVSLFPAVDVKKRGKETGGSVNIDATQQPATERNRPTAERERRGKADSLQPLTSSACFPLTE